MANFSKHVYKPYFDVEKRLRARDGNRRLLDAWEKIGNRIVCKSEIGAPRVNPQDINEMFSTDNIAYSVMQTIISISKDTDEIIVCQDYSEDFIGMLMGMLPLDEGTEIIRDKTQSRFSVVVFKSDDNTVMVRYWMYPLPTYYKEKYRGFDNVMEILRKEDSNDKRIKLWEKIGRRIFCRCGRDVVRVNQVAIDQIFSICQAPVSSSEAPVYFLEKIAWCFENDTEIVIWQDYDTNERNVEDEDLLVSAYIHIPCINNSTFIAIYKEDENTTIMKFWTPEPI